MVKMRENAAKWPIRARLAKTDDQTSVNNVCAVLLCGGQSRRLGYPKEMLRVDGEPLAAKMVERLQRLFASVAVVTDRPDFLRYCVHAPIHSDQFPGAGPLAGLHAGLKQAGTERCFVLACDMPLASDSLIRAVADRSLQSHSDAVMPADGSRLQPLCGVYSTKLLDALERFLSEGRSRSVFAFLDRIQPESFDVGQEHRGCFRDIDAAEDMPILAEAFDDVEPLPVRWVEVQSPIGPQDVVAEEWTVSVFVNGDKLATLFALPTALRELAVGVAADRGLVRQSEDVLDVTADYEKAQVHLRVAPAQGCTLAAGRDTDAKTAPGVFRVSADHILHGLQSLRSMAPVFCRTGATHQAAFSDGRAIRLFFEDVGRHNAVVKTVGRALIERVDLHEGVLLITGRINREIVAKAVRQRIPVLASKAAVTSEAQRMARHAGLTLVGFARQGRLNIYSRPDRILGL